MLILLRLIHLSLVILILCILRILRLARLLSMILHLLFWYSYILDMLFCEGLLWFYQNQRFHLWLCFLIVIFLLLRFVLFVLWILHFLVCCRYCCLDIFEVRHPLRLSPHQSILLIFLLRLRIVFLVAFLHLL